MIHDKDYLMRQVKQLSELLSRLLLGNNEGIPKEEELSVETQIRAIFKGSKEELASMSTEDLLTFISTHAPLHQVAYFETLGHFFYLQFKATKNAQYAAKAKTFYELWLKESQIFSLVITGRIAELSTVE